MEDFGDIIFYILAGIVGLISAIGRKKKKNQQQAPVPESQPADQQEVLSEDIEDIVFREAGRDVYSGPEPVFQETKAEPWFETVRTEPFADESQASEADSHSLMTEQPRIVFDSAMEGSYSEPLADDFKDEGESMTVDGVAATEIGLAEAISEEEEESIASELAREFDLPKAIIYSEIITPKYH